MWLLVSISFCVEYGAMRVMRIVPVRDDLLRGDLRALYLAWLASAARTSSVYLEDDVAAWGDANEGDNGDDSIEPPVPLGLTLCLHHWAACLHYRIVC
jgi:hypothetical protein